MWWTQQRRSCPEPLQQGAYATRATLLKKLTQSSAQTMPPAFPKFKTNPLLISLMRDATFLAYTFPVLADKRIAAVFNGVGCKSLSDTKKFVYKHFTSHLKIFFTSFVSLFFSKIGFLVQLTNWSLSDRKLLTPLLVRTFARRSVFWLLTFAESIHLMFADERTIAHK